MTLSPEQKHQLDDYLRARTTGQNICYGRGVLAPYYRKLYTEKWIRENVAKDED